MSRIRWVGVVALSMAAAVPRGSQGPGVHEVHVDVGGRTIRALCTEGPRQVLLLHGEGSSADTWRPVLERLDGSVGACAYDLGVREPSAFGSPDRGWFELEDELRRIHVALGFGQGYTLVGHSLGGLYARLFAADRRNDVGALLLLDPAHEDMAAAVRAGMPRAAWSQWVLQRQRPNADGVRESELAERARGSRLPDLPVTVITAMLRKHDAGWDQRFLSQAARRVHASILHGITSARHVPAAQSGHDVQLDAPDLVAEEIVRLVRLATRAHRGWSR